MVLVPVRFLANVSPYNAGERASFDPREAQRLISRGYAQAVVEGAPVVKTADVASPMGDIETSAGVEDTRRISDGAPEGAPAAAAPIAPDGADVVGSAAHRRRRR